jgi:hypothetical protein
MTYDKETAHREVREAISAWVLDKTLPEPEFQNCIVGKWVDRSMAAIFHSLQREIDPVIRLKPKSQPMIRVNGILCPAPETVVPAVGTLYYIPSVDSKEKFVGDAWENFPRDLRLLEAGLVYLTIENTIAR